MLISLTGSAKLLLASSATDIPRFALPSLYLSVCLSTYLATSLLRSISTVVLISMFPANLARPIKLAMFLNSKEQVWKERITCNIVYC